MKKISCDVGVVVEHGKYMFHIERKDDSITDDGWEFKTTTPSRESVLVTASTTEEGERMMSSIRKFILTL